MKKVIASNISALFGVFFGAFFMAFPNVYPMALKFGFSIGSGLSWPSISIIIILSCVVFDAVVFKRVFSACVWLWASPVLCKMLGKGLRFLYGMIFAALMGYVATGSQYAVGIALNLLIFSGMLHYYLWCFRGFDDVVRKVLIKN